MMKWNERFIRRTCSLALLSLVMFFSPLFSQDQSGHRYPRLANYYLPGEIQQRDVIYFSGWDLHVFNWYVDRGTQYRSNLMEIKRLNRGALFLMYHLAIGVNTTLSPPDPLETAAENYDWWLHDYMGNHLSDQYPWEFNQLVNFTNTAAAGGSHPNHLRANQYLPYLLIRDHYLEYEYWNGILYDVFSDNLQFLHRDIKDATVNWIPEFDSSHNGNEPLFDNLWREGMRTLAENTLRNTPDILIVGNGLHCSTTAYLNGRMQENFSRSANELSDLASLNEYRIRTERDRCINILDGIMEDNGFTDFSSMRFAFISALFMDAYFNSRASSGGRGNAFWYDEYSVRPNGRVDAVTTKLSESIDESDVTIQVTSTERFPVKGVVTIDGEQIYYSSKSDYALLDCIRGYPRCAEAITSHEANATVIHYHQTSTGYLGYPITGAFDIDDPSVKLRDLFERAGWYATGEFADEINSRIWIRLFQGGVALLNPTPHTVVVGGLGGFGLRKIEGIQDPAHNDGSPVSNTLSINTKDGYVLVY